MPTIRCRRDRDSPSLIIASSAGQVKHMPTSQSAVTNRWLATPCTRLPASRTPAMMQNPIRKERKPPRRCANRPQKIDAKV